MNVRNLPSELIEGEIAIIIDYPSGESEALSVLEGAMKIVASLDEIDKFLLSNIESSLEPVSILNDIEHSSLKMLLKRALRNLPDDVIKNLDWKIWVGDLLVKGKHALLKSLDNDGGINKKKADDALESLKENYDKPPGRLMGYQIPAREALEKTLLNVSKAKGSIPDCDVTIQSELGDVSIPNLENTEIDYDSEIIEESDADMILKIESASFKNENKWRFSDGNNSFAAKIEDEKFLGQVDLGESFSKGDSLKVKICFKQKFLNSELLSTERVIKKVYKHIKRDKAKQNQLF